MEPARRECWQKRAKMARKMAELGTKLTIHGLPGGGDRPAGPSRLRCTRQNGRFQKFDLHSRET